MDGLEASPLGGTALLEQNALVKSLWSDMTPLDSNTSLTNALTAIRSPASRGTSISELKPRSASDLSLNQTLDMPEADNGASVETSEAVLSRSNLSSQPTIVRPAATSKSDHQTKAASDSLTGTTESAPLVGAQATTQDIMIDFQPDTATVPTGYIKDVGEAYSDTRGFGWVRQDSLSSPTHTPLDITSNARDRNGAEIDPQLNTLLHMQYPDDIPNPTAVKVPAAWEYALPNGNYNVTVSVGDSSYYDSQHTINIEGINAINRFQSRSTEEFKQATVEADVKDGKLTIDAVGGTNTKINYIEIEGMTLSQVIDQMSTMPYTDPAQFTKVPFGSQSHWLQPWRAYMETVPATTFLNGTGINFNIGSSADPELVARMLAKSGIRRARVEVGWNNISYNNETELAPNKAAELGAQLSALKKYGIRPLILLNANHGVPGPENSFTRALIADANAGDTTVQLDDVTGFKVGYSGLSNLTDYWAAEALITNISGNTVTLSKPLPKDIGAGATVPITTLKYRPFSPPGSDDYQATMAGWKQYVDTVAEFVANALGTSQSSDKGFDMEIWNELTFGSNFLYINEYYAQEPYDYDEGSIYTNLVKETADFVDAHPEDFQGVLLSDGFANTIPWPASSQEPARISAISKHPYAGRKNYPQDEYKETPIDALGQEDTSRFTPTYSVLFPEYFATALQTETLVRDMGPITSGIGETMHGRNARVINGAVVPTPVWLTEVNVGPNEYDPNVTAERALALKAKTTARYFSFYLNKGVTQLHLFGTTGGDKGLGIVKQNFLDYAAQPNAVYPTNDSSYTSPALKTVGRIVAKMSQQLDPNLTDTRSLKVASISDTHNHYQFEGDGTAAHPNLYNRDVFAFLPFQVNAKRFVIPYYVMTRDITKDLAPEKFKLQLQGIKGGGASITAYDPIKNKVVPVVVNSRGPNSLAVNLTATDYPYLLTIQEK